MHAEGRILTDTHPTCVKDKSKSKIKLIKPVYSETCSMGTLLLSPLLQQRFKGVREYILLNKKEILTQYLIGKRSRKAGFVERGTD